MNDRDRAFLERHKKLADRPSSGFSGGPQRVEIAGTVKREKRYSWEFFDGAKTCFISKEHLQLPDGGVIREGMTAEFIVPGWLAKKEGLI